MSEITVHPYRLLLDGAVSATGLAASALEPQWTDVLSDCGTGSVVFTRDDPVALANDGRDLFQFRIDGQPAWVLLPDPVHHTVVAGGEEAEENVTYSGPGHLALLDRMKVYPTRGVGRLPKEQTRFFNWTNLDYDDSGWDTAKALLTTGQAKLNWPVPIDGGFPDDYAYMIWADNPGGNPSTPATADEGDCYFRHEFVVATEGLFRVFFLTDNSGDLFVDSQQMCQSDSFQRTTTQDFELTAGTHMLAVAAHNGLPSMTWAGPGGIAFAIYEVTSSGLSHISSSSDDTLVTAYAEPTGVTPGWALDKALTEGVARGEWAGLSWDFDEINDSNGNPWDAVADLATTVGGSMLDFLREVCSTYVDAYMDPDLSAGFVLHAYRRGEMGVTSGVTLSIGGNLTALEAQRENLPVTVLLIDGAKKWLEREDASAVATYGRSESTLALGAQSAESEVYRVADAQLDAFNHPREQITAGLEPDPGEVPYVDFIVGDTVEVPSSDDDTPNEERVVSIGVTEDAENAIAVFTLTCREVVYSAEERLVNIARRK